MILQRRSRPWPRPNKQMEQIRQQLDRLLSNLLNGQPLGWNNVLDVVIVAVFIYYVLVLIRGTKAVQLLIGVLVLVLIYWIARSLQLTLTTLLLQALFAVALIALVVVFQPELRRALGQIGQLGPLNRLLLPGGEEQIEGIVDELVRAALLISEAKHGALIVLERATGLQDYSETGVPVNGKLTAELLASIFMTRSPLHDGAVIVRGSQILAAACLLPLEETAERSAHRYGMRHRAALSISAQTDAIVVVVSEETQAISIAAGGRIIGALDEERLRRVLSSLLRSRIQPLPFRSKAS
ncbi:MAG: TIGR00159 family protein [Chloroflexi bacterium]|nr:MAG: TIGR00159 family protein [Chloroflexota bacterium]